MSISRPVASSIGVALLVGLQAAAWAGPGATSGSGECKELRALIAGSCETFLAAKDGGMACSAALRRLDNDEADCAKWTSSLTRQMKREQQSGLDDPWAWGPSCRAYAKSLATRCVEPLGSGSSIEGCAAELYAFETPTAQMKGLPDNASMAEELENHCKAKLAD